MSLEQRIHTFGSDQVQTQTIEPGKRRRRKFRVIERDIIIGDGHGEFDVVVSASCRKDNSRGAISLFNPIWRRRERREIFSGEIPNFLIRFPDGNFGAVEWELIP